MKRREAIRSVCLSAIVGLLLVAAARAALGGTKESTLENCLSTVVTPEQQIAPLTISSLANTSKQAVEVFRFVIRDMGCGDELLTRVSCIKVRPAPENTASWGQTLTEVLFRTEQGDLSADSVTITDMSIQANFGSGVLVVPDGTGLPVSLLVVLKAQGLQDGAKLAFRIEAVNHGFAAEEEESSHFAESFEADVVSSTHTLEVTATELRFDSTSTPSVVGVNADFPVRVQAVDANGNADWDAVGDVILCKEFGGGVLSAASGLTRPLVSGMCEWSDVRISMPGFFGLRADADGFRYAASGELAAGAVWLNEVDYDNLGTDTNEWIELAGWAGFELDAYQLRFIDQDGREYGTWKLGEARFRFEDETNGFGFVVLGRVAPGEGTADYTPVGWGKDRIQNGPQDSIELRHNSGATIHLLDYQGNNPSTAEHQTTELADRSTVLSSLYLAGTGFWFSSFFWTNVMALATPGAVNHEQNLGLPRVAPAIGNGRGVLAAGTHTAMLEGKLLTGYPYPAIFICYGREDAGATDTGKWERVVAVGRRYWGRFSYLVTGLVPGQQYHYRCYASNELGCAWSESTSAFTTRTVVRKAAPGGLYLDNVSIGKSPPACVDNDADGMSDEWERAYLGGTDKSAGGPAEDQDADGADDLCEYLAGTDPLNPNSYFGGISLDLADDACSDLVFVWTGASCDRPTPYTAAGDKPQRKYAVLRALDSGRNPKLPVAHVTAPASASVTWRDKGAAASCGRRYYALAVSFGGRSYTNSEEWACYVKERSRGQRFLECFPVKFQWPEQNNLSSTLGRQLARGLYAALDPADADRIQFMDNEGRWQEYVLMTNQAAGGVFWYDESKAIAADVPISVGMAFWVVCGTNQPPLSRAVFAGRSFIAADATPVTFTTNYGGWTMFGWPLARERQHRSGDPVPNQLGFYAVGRGGQTSDPRRPQLLGDQIWVWEGNTWKRFYWLMDRIGSGYDGRWWDDFKSTAPRFADITLGPGGAYYYFHPPNWGATNFVWRPEVP